MIHDVTWYNIMNQLYHIKSYHYHHILNNYVYIYIYVMSYHI